MDKVKTSRKKNYKEISKETKNPMPYSMDSMVTKKDFPEILCNDNTLQKLVSALKNRKDADDLFISAILKSPRFWKYFLVTSGILSIIISYLFSHYSVPMNHVIEKTVNSRIPDLFPVPS